MFPDFPNQNQRKADLTPVLLTLQAFVGARSIAETIPSAASDRDVGDKIPVNVYEGHHNYLSARGDSDLRLDPVPEWPKGKFLEHGLMFKGLNCTGGKAGKDFANGVKESINWLSGFDSGVPRAIEPNEKRGQNCWRVSCHRAVGIRWCNNVSTLIIASPSIRVFSSKFCGKLGYFTLRKKKEN